MFSYDAIEESQAVGKTIKTITKGNNDEELLIVFEDGSFLIFRSCRVDDDTEIETLNGIVPRYWQYPDLVDAFGEHDAKALWEMYVESDRKEREERSARRKAELQEQLKKLEDSPKYETCRECKGTGAVIDRGYERICGSCGATGYTPL